MILIVALCAGCGEKINYKSLTHDEAIKMFSEKPDAIVLDVRTADEFEKKHIPDAKSVPLEE